MAEQSSTSRLDGATSEGNSHAKQILEELRPRFIEEMDANDVAFKLWNKGIIADSIHDQIVKESGRKRRNEILHKCLQETSTVASLRTFCDVAIQVGEKGYPVMEKLGADMRSRLETCSSIPQREYSESKTGEPKLPRSPKMSQQTPKDEFLDLSLFWPYRCLRHVQAHFPFLSELITISLLFIVILQLLLSMLFTFSVYHSANQHSCIRSEKRFFMCATIVLYFFTRVLPLVTVRAFRNAVVSKLGTQSSSLTLDFLKQIARKENESVLQAVVHTFWDVGLAKKTYSTILRSLTQHFGKELGVMCITSTLEAAIITLMLIQVGATRFALDAHSIPLGGMLKVVIECLDAISYFALILTIGIICSFFSHEATINRLVAGAVALEDHADTFRVKPSKELIQSAKNTVNNFSNSWNITEIFLFLSVQVYTLILVLFAVAGLPLSCDITAHMHTEQLHLYWFPFIIVFSVGHFLSTCTWPSAHGASKYRVIGILLEAFLFVVLYIIQPQLFGSFLQILFAVMASAYLFWYLWMKVHYENSVSSAKPKEWRSRHQRNMGIYICLMAQLVLAIIVSTFSEYSIIRAKPAT